MTPGAEALNRLVKWRTILTGWQIGTRPKGDPQSDAIRDHREVTILLRAEVNAITQLLISKGVFTAAEFDTQLVTEAFHLERGFENKFPGASTADHGMDINLQLAEPWLSKFPK
jgi:hypothetical protein